MELRIKEAIRDYNERNQPVDHEKLKDRDIALQLFPEKKEKRAVQLFSQIKNGYQYTAVTPDVISGLCKILDTDPNTLFGWYLEPS